MKNIDSNAIEGIANELYSIYCKAVGGKAFNGDSLPDWPTFRTDPNKSKQSNAWIACAHKAAEIFGREHVIWGAGEPDCPKEIKAPNGELHTLQCKVCGSQSPWGRICVRSGFKPLN